MEQNEFILGLSLDLVRCLYVVLLILCASVVVGDHTTRLVFNFGPIVTCVFSFDRSMNENKTKYYALKIKRYAISLND